MALFNLQLGNSEYKIIKAPQFLVAQNFLKSQLYELMTKDNVELQKCKYWVGQKVHLVK